MSGRHIDDAGMNRFHVRVAAYTTGGYFCDGYILGSIGLVIPMISGPMGLGAVWQGLIAASALVGITLGAIVFGPITDRVGRQKILVFDLVVFVVASLAQLFVDGPVLLLVLRLVLGLAMGADYAIGPALLAEFVPARRRGTLLSSLNMVWTIGFVASYGAGLAIQNLGPDSWRWILASGAVPAFLTLLLRLGTPESPRWLASKGRVEEAREVVRRYIGPGYDIDAPDSGTAPARYRELFSARYRKRLLFAGGFWLCQVFPYFAIGTFLPGVLAGLGMEDGVTGEIAYNAILALGAIAGFAVMDLVPRRRFTIATFAVVAVTLLMLAVWPHGPMGYVLPTLLVLALVISAAADLESVYPAEVFPTEVRASGVGLAAAISRVGAAVGTFVMPSILGGAGISATMLVLLGVVLAGLGVSVWAAPETGRVRLSDAARAEPDVSREGIGA